MGKKKKKPKERNVWVKQTKKKAMELHNFPRFTAIDRKRLVQNKSQD